MPIFSLKADYPKALLKELFPTIILLNLYFDGCRQRRRGRRRRRGRGRGRGWRGSWRTWSTSTPDSGRLSRNLSKGTIARERITLSKSH
jgi:hypothetical protein